MACISNHAIGINKNYEWNGSSVVVIKNGTLSFCVWKMLIFSPYNKMLNLCPIPFFNPVLKFSFFVVAWYSDDTNFFTPFSTSFRKQFCIVGHRLLARSTSSVPKIEQQYLAFFMLDLTDFASFKIPKIRDSLKVVTILKRCTHIKPHWRDMVIIMLLTLFNSGKQVFHLFVDVICIF